MPTSKSQLKAYVNTDIYEKFKLIADKENRSISNYLEFLIVREIRLHEEKQVDTSEK